MLRRREYMASSIREVKSKKKKDHIGDTVARAIPWLLRPSNPPMDMFLIGFGRASMAAGPTTSSQEHDQVPGTTSAP